MVVLPSRVTLTEGVPPGWPGCGVAWAGCGAAWPGCGAGGTPALAGALLAGCFCLSRTLPVDEALRVARMASVSDVSMKAAAAMVVALDSTVADPRGPNAVCDPIPPKAPARSAALPLCSSTTTTKKKQMSM